MLRSFNVLSTDDRSEILRWLSPLEARIRHNDVRTRRADSIGEWLVRTSEFRRWCDGTQHGESDHAVLFCCGDPGVGKTYFSSLVVDRLCDKAKEQNIAVACFYVDFAAREEQSPTNILGSLLKQIVGGLERIPDEISRTFQDHKGVIGGRRLQAPEVVRVLQAVTSLQPTFICVDALDECAEGHRPEVLDSLRKILEMSPNTRIFLTGRRHIRSEIDRHFGGRAAVLSIKPNDDDIVEYIRMRLSKDASPDAMDSSLEEGIIKSIAQNIPETFLQISLTMDAILGETTVYGRGQRLKEMREGLDLKGLYSAALERIKEQGGEKTRLGMAALMWVSHSERLLQLNEISHALAVEIGSTDLNAENIPLVETLLSCCLGLVVADREASTVRLIHFTLQEYIYTCPGLFGATHSIMAETCLTYLNSQTIEDISSRLFAPPQSTAFLKYSSLYWGAHARREASRGVVSLALNLFSKIDGHISTKVLLVDLISRAGRYPRDIPVSGPLIGFTGLHCASVFGIVEIATLLMDQPNPDLNKRDFLGITPLIWAAICGQEEVAKLLLERQAISPDKPDGHFRRAALSWAAWKGHEGIVRLLLERVSAKPDSTDGWWGRMPRVVNKVRGRRYVTPNMHDKYGQTAILLAAEEGHEGVVRLLLGRKDINPNTSSKDGETPLSLASGKGHGGVVQLLLGREDVNLDLPENGGRTLLSWAAENGHDEVVRLLLRREDANPDRPDLRGQTPLSWAAENGHQGVVNLLLGREDVNPDMPDNGGRTPLWWAAARGRDDVVQLLLGREDVNPDRPDFRRQKPLLLAAGNGHDRVVKLLLEPEAVNPNTADNSGRTPLLWASREGYDRVVELLLEREDVNPDMPDKGGRAPVSWSAENGHDGVVRLLMGREDFNPDMPDKRGQTPLSWAAESGHDDVVKLLLGRGDVNPNMPDNGGRTPLWWAAARGRDDVVQLLLGREDVNPDMPDFHGQTPLLWAAGNGHDRTVNLLLELEAVNPNTADNSGRTPLLWASEKGYDRVVELLLGREDVSPHMPDRGGRTPLSGAAAWGHDEVVKLLQAHKSANPNTA